MTGPGSPTIRRVRSALARRIAGESPVSRGPAEPPREEARYPTLLEWNTGAYRRHVHDLVASHDLDEAMSLAIGGWWDETGPLLEGALEFSGMPDDGVLIDVGCGSGRLTVRLSRRFGGTYVGCDVVDAFVAYTRAHSPNPAWRFEVTSAPVIPIDDGVADVACFFSVFTHLPHEAIYAYLTECHRALRPGGVVVASFLEFVDPALWPVFSAMVESIGTAGHLNQFVHREDIAVWCGRIGLTPERFIGATEQVIPIRDVDGTEIGTSHFGQAVMILRKP